MITGTCPHCGDSMGNQIPDGAKLPAFGKVECDGCKNEMWLKFSRVSPCVYTLEQFDVGYEIVDGVVRKKE
jgi:hypothetical protein